MKKIITGLYFIMLILNGYSQLKVGDIISIEYNEGGSRCQCYVCYGWYKVVENNITKSCFGKDLNNLFFNKYNKQQNRSYLDETINPKNFLIYDSQYLDSLQFIIQDGDTINYYDTIGKKQGWFIVGRYIIDDFNIAGKKKYYLNKCSYCNDFLEYRKFKNDTLIQSYVTGFTKEKKIDTIEQFYYINDTIFLGKSRENDNFYTIRYYKGKDMLKYKELNDTVWSYYSTGELYSIYRQGLFSQIGLVKAYWKNGNIKFIKNYDNGSLNGTITYYRENGTKEKEFYYEYGKLLKSKCYDIKGKCEVNCK